MEEEKKELKVVYNKKGFIFLFSIIGFGLILYLVGSTYIVSLQLMTLGLLIAFIGLLSFIGVLFLILQGSVILKSVEDAIDSDEKKVDNE